VAGPRPHLTINASLVEEESDDKSIDFGLEGDEPDCRVYLAHSVTTLSWLKSHHLLVT
jgi:hypothetical protein